MRERERLREEERNRTEERNIPIFLSSLLFLSLRKNKSNNINIKKENRKRK